MKKFALFLIVASVLSMAVVARSQKEAGNSPPAKCVLHYASDAVMTEIQSEVAVITINLNREVTRYAAPAPGVQYALAQIQVVRLYKIYDATRSRITHHLPWIVKRE